MVKNSIRLRIIYVILSLILVFTLLSAGACSFGSSSDNNGTTDEIQQGGGGDITNGTDDGEDDENKNPDQSEEDLGGYYYGSGDKIANFEKGLSSNFHAANGWSNGGMFDCTWSSNNVAYNSSTKLLELQLTKGNDGKNYAGEYRSNNFYQYGYFSVRMKAVKKDGVVSSLFTYTGSVDNNPWDEIDIEFLGKDTTKVQFNYYTNGVGGHEYIYDLGFDAAEELHEYAFKWESDKITWYVDGKPVYRATKDIPQTAGRIMINAWQGKAEDVKDWSGVFDGVYPVAPAEYKWIGYKALA